MGGYFWGGYSKEIKEEKVDYDRVNEIIYENYLSESLKNEKSNIRFKYIKDIILESKDSDFCVDTMEYIDKIKSIFCLYNYKIFCLKYPDLIRILEYEEIMNCNENIHILSYQENTNRIFVLYYINEESFTKIYTLKDNKIYISGCLNYSFDDIIDLSDNKIIILDYHDCKCLQFIDNEYKIIKFFDEKFYSIQAFQKKR